MNGNGGQSRVGRFFSAFYGMWRGGRQTMREAFRPAFTTQYPDELLEVSPRWRGPLRLRGIMNDEPPPVTSASPIEYNKLLADLDAKRRLAPCIGECPGNVDGRGQNALIAAGEAARAYELVRERNTLPGVLGFACPNPCENVCRRSYFEEPISIRQLHRAAYDAYHARPRPHLTSDVTRKQRVAVVGAGPAGLTVGYDLLRLGYGVTAFDRYPEPGGLLLSGVPIYRLDRNVLRNEVEDLREMGMEFHCEVDVGPDIPLEKLREDYDAVVLAIGLSRPRKITVPNVDAPRSIAAMEFLPQCNMGGKPEVGDTVIVIGAGDVSVDCARSALRFGAKKVFKIMLEMPDEAPAQDREVEEELAEGVIHMCRWGPKEVLVDEKGETKGLRIRKCSRVFDEAGHFSPKFIDELDEMQADTVIWAVGQGADTQFLSGTGIGIDPLGNLVLDRATSQTTFPDVFAAGDISGGPGTIIKAMSAAHETAISVHRFLEGQDLKAKREAQYHPRFYRYVRSGLAERETSSQEPRALMPLSDPHRRLRDPHLQEELGLAPQMAKVEAMRCLRCQTQACVGCSLCARVCPDNCITVEKEDDGVTRKVTRWDFKMEWCCFCGLCQDICPTQTLSCSAEYHTASRGRGTYEYDLERMLRDFDGPQEVQCKDGWP